MITVHEAAVLLDGTEAWVRSLLRRGICGDAWNNSRRGQRFTYVIVPGQLAEYMRISEKELERRLAEIRERKRYYDGLCDSVR